MEGDMNNLSGNTVQKIFTIENTSNMCMAKAMMNLDKQNLTKNSLTTLEQLFEDKETTGWFQSTSPSKNLEAESDQAIIVQLPKVDMTEADEWQRDFITPTQRLSQLFASHHLADVTITFPDSPEKFKAHRLLLASASPVFERMFYGDTKEARTGEVCLHGCCPVAVEYMLQNIYNGKTSIEDINLAIDVFNVAQMYQISALATMCRDYMKCTLSPSTVPEIFKVALTHSDEALIEDCVVILSTSWLELQKEHFHRMTETLWIYLLRREVLPSDEISIFQAIYFWSKTVLEKANIEPTPSAIRNKLSKLLPHIRLLAISADSFIDNILPTGIFTSEECTNILKKLRGLETPMRPSVKFSPIPFNRIEMTDKTLKSVVLSRVTDCRKYHPTVVSEIELIKDLMLSSPIILKQIQTHDNATLKNSQMTITDPNGKHIGVAKPQGAYWKFITPTYLHANKRYSVNIDRVLVNKTFSMKNFCSYIGDLRIKGTTGDNFIKFHFWSPELK